MKIKDLAKGTLSRILRYTGILLLIYISMVFYLALTERRNAFPRAITHNEARAAIADKAKNINCTLDDGTVLEGFVVGNEHNNVLLYYPDADEDAAAPLIGNYPNRGVMQYAQIINPRMPSSFRTW